MGRISGRDTRPEILVRSFLHQQGLRFRVHGAKLPGRPDVVLKGRHAVIFIHGCYWHRHEGCAFAYTPKSNVQFWSEKFRQNVARDARVRSQLKASGWRVYVIWECEVETPRFLRALAAKLAALKTRRMLPRAISETPAASSRRLDHRKARRT